MRGLKSRPPDAREMRRRIESALGKHARGERLTETEETIVYWLLHAGGCHACGGEEVVGPAIRQTRHTRYDGEDRHELS